MVEFIPGVTAHARQRMLERLGRDPCRAEWLAMVAAIIERRALLLAVKHGAETWLVASPAGDVMAVWSPASAAIITVKAPGEQGISRRADMAKKNGRIRATLTIPGGYRRGKRWKAKTIWQGDDHGGQNA